MAKDLLPKFEQGQPLYASDLNKIAEHLISRIHGPNVYVDSTGVYFRGRAGAVTTGDTEIRRFCFLEKMTNGSISRAVEVRYDGKTAATFYVWDPAGEYRSVIGATSGYAILMPDAKAGLMQLGTMTWTWSAETKEWIAGEACPANSEATYPEIDGEEDGDTTTTPCISTIDLWEPLRVTCPSFQSYLCGGGS